MTLTYRCLALTGTFETNLAPPDCFSGLAGDFDGQGLSFSALQWNLGQGTLQKLLSEMTTSHAAVMQSVFGTNNSAITTMLKLPHEGQMAWARSIQSQTHKITDPWAELFHALGKTPEFQTLATTHANTLYAAALDLCRTFQLTTERAAALMFDIEVQNGGISKPLQSSIQSAFDPQATELEKLQLIANRRADAAAAPWREDVRTRKLTIANGSGTVHGRTFNLETQFGITLNPWKPKADS